MNPGIVETLLDNGVSEPDIERFLKAFGGLPLYIPVRFDPSHPIAVAAGEQIASVLCSIYSGEQPVMPTGAELHRQKKNARVRQLARDGKNCHEIARETRLHLRQVYRIVSRMDPAERPPKEDPNQLYFC